jgi:signal transduction histidine kinase
VSAAITSAEARTSLFAHLADLARPSRSYAVSVTIYVPDATGAFQVFAWSSGPAESVSRDRLAGPAAVFVARGSAGLHLVATTPVDFEGRRIATVAAEAIVSAVSEQGASTLQTSFGPVTIIPPYAGAGEEPGADNRFLISGDNDAALLEVRFTADALEQRRRAFRTSVVLIAALPLVLLMFPLVSAFLARRQRTRDFLPWLGWSLAAMGCVALAAGALVLLGKAADLPPAVVQCVIGAAAFGAIGIFPGGAWWRQWSRRGPAEFPVRFIAEHGVSGVGLALALRGIARLIEWRTTPTSLDRWQAALFPFDANALAYLVSGLLIELAICWAAASTLAIVTLRWRVLPFRGATLAAVALWIAPGLLMLVVDRADVPLGPALIAASCAVAFTLAAASLRRAYRRSTQSFRLLLGFLAILAPLVAVYPMASAIVDAGRRRAIENVYSPATMRHPEDLRAELGRAQTRVDELWTRDAFLRTRLATLPSPTALGPAPVDTQMAYLVWSQTPLSQRRAVSGVEIYGADRSLVSRFALNLPEYLYRATSQTWPDATCEWDTFGETIRFGAEDRLMLHAQRGFCDASGTLLGAVVVHVARNDYQALPFLPSSSPYYDLIGLGPGSASTLRPPDLDVVVYGWSLRPLFSSSRVAWPISELVFRRLYSDGRPFWTTLTLEATTFQVYFSQDRQGIYALGYASPTLFEHATRLAEIGALVGVLFIAIQLGAAFYLPMARRRHAPVRLLYQEVRTSFYRKLFLYFVLIAIVPVVIFGLVFGAYMTAKFRADVESEAKSTVTVARRVFEELSAAEQRPGQAQPSPSDDVMVWIRQVIDEDVHLYEGPNLVATSQRDLFDSGLLPGRTPAAIYRAIALQRLPAFVGEDRQGGFQYLIAAAPIPNRSANAILSVPLAPRQREIEREIDELNRGVLVGSILVVLFAAALGASIASRIADPVARLTRATRQIAAGRLDVRIAADTADELRRLVDAFNSMAETLLAQRTELARTHQIKAWNEMARQVAHEIKNPLTPIQLAAEHLQRVHEDQGRPLAEVFDQCLQTILGQVRLLRRIASEFANFAAQPTPRPEPINLSSLVDSIVDPYRVGLEARISIAVDVPASLPAAVADSTLLARALTNLVENAVQAMPSGGSLRLSARAEADRVVLRIVDTGVGMDATNVARAFEPYFSTKTGGSGLGLANAKRTIELGGGTIALTSAPGEGTSVIVSLPLSASRPGEIETA